MKNRCSARTNEALAALATSALLFALVFVPVLVRAVQMADVGPTQATHAIGFHKSVDAPPDPPSRATTDFLVHQGSSPANPPHNWCSDITHDPVLATADVCGCECRRGPPVAQSA